ncbi:hypothetical protein B7P43_G08463 [Cryptotermes secundus]|uniref:Uncharacterized protein n=1 Tax=Cryptotermes secundus TaxID=105785 RepID=A0A2J7R5Z3_9NEOP|nr:hypothetical protein B7P43_G08463 [Cryptotermes secundus]
MAESKCVYTKEEIAQLAPRYRGKPENFDPSKKRPPGPILKKIEAPKKKLGPASPTMTRGSEVDKPQKSTPQRNDSIISKSIFGVDVCIVPIEPRQNFQTNLSKIDDIATETYSSYVPDFKQLDRKLAKEEVAYYATGLLWLKLIDIKAKQGRQALSSDEKELRKATNEVEFNVPQPIHAFLAQIGNVTDKMGKETELDVPNLPTSVAQGLGGYHSPTINEDNHNLFEEIPSLGIVGDMVMLLTSEAPEPELNIRVGHPQNTIFTEYLVGVRLPMGPRCPEIVQRLAGQGITTAIFPEYVENTRFNLRYMLSISDILGQFEMFRIEKVSFPKLTMSGGISQVILTKPLLTVGLQQNWCNTIVQATSAANESIAEMGA